MDQPAQLDADSARSEPEGGSIPFRIEFGNMLCLGCRPSGRCRYGVELQRDGADAVVGTVRFSADHEGVGGVVHGGAVMGALDEACGAVTIAAHVLSVTAEMDVRFWRPVPMLRELTVRAWPESRSERGHWIIRAELLMAGDDRPLCEARARFVERDPEKHYGRFQRWLEHRDAAANEVSGHPEGAAPHGPG